MKRILNSILVIILVFFFMEPANSQSNHDTINLDDYYIDFSVPDLGAFTLLNTKPDNISTPGNTKEFAASLLNVISGGSKISPGLAIDWAPVRTFYKTTTPYDYKRTKLFRNLQLTLGTISDSLGTRVGAGIKWTFIDQTDPLSDMNYSKDLINLRHRFFVNIETVKNIFIHDIIYFLKDIQIKRPSLKENEDSLYKNHNILKIFDWDTTSNINTKKELWLYYSIASDSINNFIKKNFRNSNDTLNVEEKERLYHFCFRLKMIIDKEEQYDKDLTIDFEKLKKNWLNTHWNATVVSFGAGWVWNSTDAKWSTLKTELFKIYLNGKFKFPKKSKRSQLIGMISYGIPKNYMTSDSSIMSQVFFGSRFLIGNAISRFSLDLGYSSYFAKVSSYNSKTLISDIGVEFKLSEGIFLEIAGGFKGKPSNFIKNSNILALGSLKYTFHPKSRFNLPE